MVKIFKWLIKVIILYIILKLITWGYFGIKVDPKRSSHWSLEGKIQKMKIFADDVMGTVIDQKYFWCIKWVWVTDFKLFSAENGIVGVSLRVYAPVEHQSALKFKTSKRPFSSSRSTILLRPRLFVLKSLHRLCY